MEKFSLLDILLLPKSFYTKLTDKLLTLYLGIAFVGLFDTGFALVANNKLRLFFGRPYVFLVYNISLALCVVILLGLIDIVFFSLPLFDIFKFFRVKERIKDIKGQLIKLMKVYVVSHFIIIPIEILIALLGFRMGIGDELTAWSVSGVLAFYALVFAWYSAVLTRGINAIYNFDDRLKNIVFVTVYTWSTLLSFAVSLMMERWILPLFR